MKVPLQARIINEDETLIIVSAAGRLAVRIDDENRHVCETLVMEFPAVGELDTGV